MRANLMSKLEYIRIVICPGNLAAASLQCKLGLVNLFTIRERIADLLTGRLVSPVGVDRVALVSESTGGDAARNEQIMAKVIDASEVKGGRRGRTPNTTPAILEAMVGLKPGQAIKFAKSDGIPVTEANSSERQTVRANLVSHWKQAGHITVADGVEISGHKASVQFDPADGLPAVKFGKGVGTDADTEDSDDSEDES